MDAIVSRAELPATVREALALCDEEKQQRSIARERAGETRERLDAKLQSEVLACAEATSRRGEADSARGAISASVALPAAARATPAAAQYYIAMAAVVSWERPDAFMLPRSFAHLMKWLNNDGLCERSGRAHGVVSLLPPLAAVMLERALDAADQRTASDTADGAPARAGSGGDDDDDWPLQPAMSAIEDIFGPRMWVDHVQCSRFVSKLLTVLTGEDEEAMRHNPMEEGGAPRDASVTANEQARADAAELQHSQQREQAQTQAQVLQQQQQQLLLPPQLPLRASTKTKGSAATGSDRSVGVAAGATPSAWTPSSRTKYRSSSSISDARALFMKLLRGFLSGKKPSEFTPSAFSFLSLATHFAEGRAFVSSLMESFVNTSSLSRMWRPLLDQLLPRIKTDDEHDLQAVTNLVGMKIRNTNVSLHNEIVMTLSGARREYGGIAIRAFAADISPQNPMNLKSLSAVFPMMRGSGMYAEKVLAEHLLSLAASDEKRGEIRPFIRQLAKAPKIIENVNVAGLCEHVLMQDHVDVTLMPRDSKVAFLTQVIDIVTTLEIVIFQHDGEKNSGGTSAALAEDISSLFAKHLEWCQTVLTRALPSIPKSNFVSVVRRLLFLEREDRYFTKNESVGEAEKAAIRALRKTRIQEEIVIRIVLMGLSADVPLAPDAALRTLEELVLKESRPADRCGVAIESAEIVEAVLKLSAFRPDGAQGESDALLAIESVYWRAWLVVAAVSVSSSEAVRMEIWNTRPRCVQLWEMLATGSRAFPPAPSSDAEAAALSERGALAMEHSDAIVENMRENLGDGAIPACKVVVWDAHADVAKPPFDVLRRLDELDGRLALGHRLRSMQNPAVFAGVTSRQSLETAWRQWLKDLALEHADALQRIPVSWCWPILFALDTPGSQKHIQLVHVLRRLLWTELDVYVSGEAVPAQAGSSSSSSASLFKSRFLDFIRQVASPSIAIRTRVSHCLNGLLVNGLRTTPVHGDESRTTVAPCEVTHLPWMREVRRMMSSSSRASSPDDDPFRALVTVVKDALAYTRDLRSVALYLDFVYDHGASLPSKESAAFRALLFAAERPLHAEHLMMNASGVYGGSVLLPPERRFTSLVIAALEATSSEDSGVSARMDTVHAAVYLVHRLRRADVARRGYARTRAAIPGDVAPLTSADDGDVRDALESITAKMRVSVDTQNASPSNNIEVDRAFILSRGMVDAASEDSRTRPLSIWRQLALFESRQLFESIGATDASFASSFSRRLARAREVDARTVPAHLFQALLTSHGLSTTAARTRPRSPGEGTKNDAEMEGPPEETHDDSRPPRIDAGHPRKRARHRAIGLTRASASLDEEQQQRKEEPDMDERMCNVRIKMACAASALDVGSVMGTYAPNKSLAEFMDECRHHLQEQLAGRSAGSGSRGMVSHHVHMLHSLRRAARTRAMDAQHEAHARELHSFDAASDVDMLIRSSVPPSLSSDHFVGYHELEPLLCSMCSASSTSVRGTDGDDGVVRPPAFECVEHALQLMRSFATRKDEEWMRSTPSAVTLSVNVLVLMDPDIAGADSRELVRFLRHLILDRHGKDIRHAMCALRQILAHVASASAWDTKAWAIAVLLREEGARLRGSQQLASLTLDFLECVVPDSRAEERRMAPVAIDENLALPVLSLVVAELCNSAGTSTSSRLKTSLGVFSREALVRVLPRLMDACRDADLAAPLSIVVDKLSVCGVRVDAPMMTSSSGAEDRAADASSRRYDVRVPEIYGLLDHFLAGAVRVMSGDEGSSSDALSTFSSMPVRLASALRLCSDAAQEKPSALVEQLGVAAVVLNTLIAAAMSGCQKSLESLASGIGGIALILEHLAVSNGDVGWHASIDRVVRTILVGATRLPAHMSSALEKPLDKLALSVQDYILRSTTAREGDGLGTATTASCAVMQSDAKSGIESPWCALPLEAAASAFPGAYALGALRRTLRADTGARTGPGRSGMAGSEDTGEAMASDAPHAASVSVAYVEALGYLGARALLDPSFDLPGLVNALRHVEVLCSSVARFPERLFTPRTCSLLVRIALRHSPGSAAKDELRPLAWRLLRTMLQTTRPQSMPSESPRAHLAPDDACDHDELVVQKIASLIGSGLSSALARGSDVVVVRGALDACPTLVPLLPSRVMCEDIVMRMVRAGATHELTALAMSTVV